MFASRLAVLLSLSIVGVFSVGCLDSTGKTVPWWFVYKLPDSYQFAYKDSNDLSASLSFSNTQNLNTTNNPIAYTLNQVYHNKKSITYLAWNDEFPSLKRTVGGGGHTKGVLAASTTSGFWLVHSVPKFPSLHLPTYAWGSAAVWTAQSFLCLTLDPHNIEMVAIQLMYTHPDFYDSFVASASVYPNISSVLAGKSHIATLKAKDSSFSFTSFAKSNNWGEDLCENLVSPYYKQGFFWETWRRNPPLPSYCPPVHKYEELNINYVALPGTNYKWHYTQDHSKWGVSAIASQPITCVGGINRMESQRKRGGGTVCQTYSPMWRAMYALISQADNC